MGLLNLADLEAAIAREQVQPAVTAVKREGEASRGGASLKTSHGRGVDRLDISVSGKVLGDADLAQAYFTLCRSGDPKEGWFSTQAVQGEKNSKTRDLTPVLRALPARTPALGEVRQIEKNALTSTSYVAHPSGHGCVKVGFVWGCD